MSKTTTDLIGDPIDTERCRGLAADWSVEDGHIRNALEAAVDEIDRLRNDRDRLDWMIEKEVSIEICRDDSGEIDYHVLLRRDGGWGRCGRDAREVIDAVMMVGGD